MESPPRCPNPQCTHHRRPRGTWWRRRGWYRARCRAVAVPRFDCKRCGRGFSRQTFRADYRDRKPWVNAPLARLLASGVGLRQSARLLRMTPNNLMAKALKLSLQCLHAHRNLLRRLEFHDPTFLLDEFETFEGSRRTRPLTAPVIIEKESMLIVAADADTIPARGRLHPRFQRVKDADERREGRRRNRSSRVVARVLKVAARASKGVVHLICDEKRTYPILARRAFGRCILQQFSSKLPRTAFNPLFPINLTEAMLRDLLGRLRRRSWLASKKRQRLRSALAVTVCYRNYVRPRFNRDTKNPVRTPAQFAGLCSKPLAFEHLLGWRQDGGSRSPPLVH